MDLPLVAGERLASESNSPEQRIMVLKNEFWKNGHDREFTPVV
jgi:hypothetical protein